MGKKFVGILVLAVVLVAFGIIAIKNSAPNDLQSQSGSNLQTSSGERAQGAEEPATETAAASFEKQIYKVCVPPVGGHDLTLYADNTFHQKGSTQEGSKYLTSPVEEGNGTWKIDKDSYLYEMLVINFDGKYNGKYRTYLEFKMDGNDLYSIGKLLYVCN